MRVIVISFLCVVLLCTCRKAQDPSLRPIDQLPPATKVGANKAGCLVDGEVLLPRNINLFGPPVLTCYYQFIDGSFYFGLGITNYTSATLKGITILSKELEFKEGTTYTITAEEAENTVYAYYSIGSEWYGTNQIHRGELTITYLNPSLSIISGTFWFDAVNSEGKVVQVREGRFDMQYSP